jgi:hypothetical protein
MAKGAVNAGLLSQETSYMNIHNSYSAQLMWPCCNIPELSQHTKLITLVKLFAGMYIHIYVVLLFILISLLIFKYNFHAYHFLVICITVQRTFYQINI